MKRVLLADDEPLALTLLRHMIDWEHYGLELAGSAQNGDELYEMIFALRPDIVITDIEMPGRSGLEIIAKSIEAGLAVRFIIVSAYTSFDYARRAIQLGAEDFLPKPVNRRELLKTLQTVMKKLEGDRPEEEPVRKLIQAAKAYLDVHFDQHLTLEQVADYVYVSPSYLSTLFKKETGVNFSEYLTDIRMQNARRLLDESAYSVSQIAKMVGYRDVKHFSSLFVKHYQISPAQYRKQGGIF